MSKLGEQLGIEQQKPEEVKPAETNPQETPKPSETATPELSAEEEDRIALAAINKRRGTNFATLEEAFATPAQQQPQESEEEKAEKRNKAKIKFALDNNLTTTTELESYHQDTAKEARTVVFEEFQKKHREAGKSDEWIAKAFAKLYGEDLDEEEDDDTPTFVKNQRKEDLERERKRILKNRYAKIHSLDKEYDAFETKQKTEQQNLETLRTNARQYEADVNQYFSDIKPIKLKVGGEAGKPETDFETDFSFSEEIRNKIKAEVLEQNTVLSFIGNYDKDALYKYIHLRLLEESEADRIGHAAKKFYSHKKDEQARKRLNLGEEEMRGGGGSGTNGKRSRLADAIGIPTE